MEGKKSYLLYYIAIATLIFLIFVGFIVNIIQLIMGKHLFSGLLSHLLS